MLICGAVVWMAPGNGPGALTVCLLVSLPTLFVLTRAGDERQFLFRVFTLAILARIVVATIIFVAHKEEFFGGDANTYDGYGASLLQAWHGDTYHAARYTEFIKSGAGAWGMLYLVAIVYQFVGENRFAIQLINASVGAAAAVAIYYSAQTLFSNTRVSRVAAILVAFFPSLILWSSQALKDGLIILALALAILATLRLMEKVTASWVVVLAGCLFALLSLRFYIFYMMTAAVVGSFILGSKTMNRRSVSERFVSSGAIGLACTWLGVLRAAGTQFQRFGDLAVIQQSRIDQANAGSGFGKDVDVSTTEGALTAIPIGLVYLLFAPFPWDIATLRQSITLPEMLIWWASFPLLVLGLWYALRHRLRQVAPVVIFTTMLTLVYSVFQGNVGTAYRQRSQLLIFYFIFVAVGGVLLKEKSEDKRRQAQLAKQELAEMQAARVLARRQGQT
jgi:4-amino-4-deoxy-L-arabinose transferase-like glycosyltransferase